MKTLSFLGLIITCLFLLSAKEAPDQEVKVYKNAQPIHGKILSRHETLAVYQGKNFSTCRGRTSACPQTCSHSGEYALFTIESYKKYHKPGKYGDAKQKVFRVRVSDFNKNAVGNPNLLAYLKGLKKGDKIDLTWNHEYGTVKNSTYPIRVIRAINKR